jgi:hypothetical protein
LYDAQNWCL